MFYETNATEITQVQVKQGANSASHDGLNSQRFDESFCRTQAVSRLSRTGQSTTGK
jgi:hypothetical protein